MDLSDEQQQSASREVIKDELLKETSERIARIAKEFADGFALMGKYNYTVSIFGSARIKEDHPYYQKAREIAAGLAREGFTIVTGGGGGVMEAGDRGATEAGGQSVGLNIQLPFEQKANPYTTESMSYRYFFTRKVILAFEADAYICFPGGYGTFDELFEIITLVQTKKMPKAPIILVGSEYWTALDMFIKAYMLDDEHYISPGDEKLYTITEDYHVIKAIIEHHRDTANAFTEKPESLEDSDAPC